MQLKPTLLHGALSICYSVLGLAAAVPRAERSIAMTIWADSCNPTYLVVVSAGNVEDLPPAVVLLLYVTFSVAFVYFLIVDTAAEIIKLDRSTRHGRYAIRVKLPTDAVTTTAQFRDIDVGYKTRGDKPPPITFNSIAAKQSYSIKSFDDGSSLNENTYGTSGYCTASSNYSDSSYKSRIVGGGNVKPTLTRAMFQGTESVADKDCGVHRHTIEKSQQPSLQDGNHGRSFREAPHTDCNFSFIRNESSLAYTVKQKDLEVPQKQVHRNSETQISSNEHFKRQTVRNEPIKPSAEKFSPSLPEPRLFTGYNKPTYAVLIGNSVKVYSTGTYASLPHSNKFLVKERHRDTSGITRVRLTLKSTENESSNVPKGLPDEDVEKDGANTYYGEKVHYRENIKRTGHVIYTCDGRFRGDIKYPLPNNKATDSKIGKGGNGFVFTIYHERKQYAVKKTVYRPNEINVHSALKHENILPLVAVLMGEKHERHSGRFYCFHFMPKMDYDLRQILSTKEVGSLKHFYNHCSAHMEPEKWDTAYRNIKFVLTETLKALSYLHSNGYVHRDIKASNIMIKMRCQCKPLSCSCKTKPQIKLGDFDSAGTVPGLGITEPTDQIIKFASILPLGTPGYRAPEVSMHITLSGPYETLYTTAVDMWSFGCLCLNICIGKTAALKQREEASLLLSLTHPTCSQELWEKTTKIKELERAKPFSHDANLIKLVRSCLQVESSRRPTANDVIKLMTS